MSRSFVKGGDHGIGAAAPPPCSTPTRGTRFETAPPALVQARHPALRAKALGYLPVVDDPDWRTDGDRLLAAYRALARAGLAGANVSTAPYDREASPALGGCSTR